MKVCKAVVKNLICAGWMLVFAVSAHAQLGSNCTATIANRSVQISPDGTYAIPNIPTDLSFYRVRVVCKNPDGTVTQGQSAFVSLVARGNTDIPGIVFGTVTPPPVSINLASSAAVLTKIGQTTQLSVTGTMPDGTMQDLSTQALGTLYVSSNPTIGGSTTKSLIDDYNPTRLPQVLDEIVNGSVNRTYSYGRQRISENQLLSSSWVSIFYGYDGHGNVRFLTNASGAITDTYTYDAFGMQIARTGTTPNAFQYSSEWLDSNLGLYYLRARHLNQATGRFWNDSGAETRWSTQAAVVAVRVVAPVQACRSTLTFTAMTIL